MNRGHAEEAEPPRRQPGVAPPLTAVGGDRGKRNPMLDPQAKARMLQLARRAYEEQKAKTAEAQAQAQAAAKRNKLSAVASSKPSPAAVQGQRSHPLQPRAPGPVNRGAPSHAAISASGGAKQAPAMATNKAAPPGIKSREVRPAPQLEAELSQLREQMATAPTYGLNAKALILRAAAMAAQAEGTKTQLDDSRGTIMGMQFSKARPMAA